MQLAKTIGDWVDGIDPTSATEVNGIAARLKSYSAIIEPWARSVATRMLGDVADLDRRNWRALSAEMGRLFRHEIETAPTGMLMQSLLREQVGLITSLPIEAAERVQRLAVEGLANATRASEIATEIMRSGEVAKSRAMTIARTEVSRAHTTINMTRAQHAGSTMFIWRTSGDGDVRKSHKVLNGRSFHWDEPPECDPGHHALPGCIWNCRCWAEPIFDD